MVLIYAEFDEDGKLTATTKELFTVGAELASKLGSDLEAVVLGENPQTAADEAATYATKVYTVSDAQLSSYRAGTYASALSSLISDKNPDVVLFSDNLGTRDFSPRLAALLDSELTTGANAVRADDYEGTLSLYMDKAVLDGKRVHTYVTSSFPALVTIESGAADEASPSQSGTVEAYSTQFSPEDLLQKILKEAEAPTGGIDLSAANVIVSVGAGIRKDTETGLKLANELADLLGGALGASRVACDAGWTDPSLQIGQTGQMVKPDLYIACGISGQIQHVTGMRKSKTILAINTDPEAPIMKVADYAIVGDLYEVLPRLIEELKK